MAEVDQGRIEVSGERVVISGTVPDQAAKDRILSFFSQDKWNGLAIVDQIKIVPPVKPPQFSLRWSGGKWVLLGQVESPETREAIAKSFSDAGIEADNQITVGEGIAPLGPLAGAFSKLPAAMGMMDQGELVWSPDQLVINGIARDQGVKDKVVGVFQADPWKGIKLVDRIQTIKPYGFSLTRGDGKLILEGSVSNQEVRESLASASRLEGLTLENQIKVDPLVKPFESGLDAREGIAAWIAGVSQGKITVSPEQIKLTGEVKDQAGKDAILRHFGPEKWPGFKMVDELKINVPMMSPSLSWKQESPSKLILSGRVSSREDKQALVALAKQRLGANGEVVDKLTVAENVKPAPWLEGFSKFAKESLSKIDSSFIEINDQVSSLSGLVPNQDAVKDVSLAFSGINPPGKIDISLSLPQMETARPAKTVSPMLEITGKGPRLAITGKVPSKELHESLVNTIVNIKDAGIDTLDKRSLKVGEDVKDESYLKPLPVFVGKFFSGKVKEREIWLEDKKLTLQGVVPNENEKKQILALADPLRKEGVEIIDKIRIEAAKVGMVPVAPSNGAKKMEGKAEAPKSMVASTGKPFSVYYGTGEFHLRDSEKARVQKLVEQAKNTKGRIVIEGYADERGTDELNAFLSNERAARLREILVSQGIEESRIISVIGKGALPGAVYRQHRRTDVRFVEHDVNEK